MIGLLGYFDPVRPSPQEYVCFSSSFISFVSFLCLFVCSFVPFLFHRCRCRLIIRQRQIPSESFSQLPDIKSPNSPKPDLNPSEIPIPTTKSQLFRSQTQAPIPVVSISQCLMSQTAKSLAPIPPHAFSTPSTPGLTPVGALCRRYRSIALSAFEFVCVYADGGGIIPLLPFFVVG